MMHQVLKTKYHGIAVVGYLRKHCHLFLPNEILNVILNAYQSHHLILTIRLDHERLIGFKNADSNHKLWMQRVPFSIDRFEFYCCLSPNYYAPKDSVTFGVALKQLPSNVDNVVVYYKLHCRQTNTQFHATKTLKQADTIEWTQNLLSMAHIHSLGGNILALDFTAECDVLRIEYLAHCYRPIRVASNSHFQFTATAQMLRKYGKHHKPFVSKLFNDGAFCLLFEPQKSDDDHLLGYSVALKLCSLPSSVAALNARVTFIDNDGKPESVQAHLFRYKDNGVNRSSLLQKCAPLADFKSGSECLSLGVIQRELWQNLTMESNNCNLCLGVAVEILNMYDGKHNLVTTHHWRKFNVDVKRKRCDYEFNTKAYNEYMDSDKHVRLKWIIGDRALLDFFGTAACSPYRCEYVEVGVFGFDICLYPNGVTAQDTGFVQFCIILKKVPSDLQIAGIVIFYRLSMSCKDTKVKYKDTAQMDTIGKGVKWASYSMSLAHCQQLRARALTFECDINVIRIEYRHDALQQPPYHKCLPATVETFYQWHMNQKMLKKASVGQVFHSERFGHIWCLDICPMGFNEHDAGSIRLSLVNLGLPPHVSAIQCSVCLECDYHQKKWEKKQFQFSYTEKVLSWPQDVLINPWTSGASRHALHENADDDEYDFKYSEHNIIVAKSALTRPNLKTHEKLKYFTVRVHILKVYGANGDKIAKRNWCKFGIFDVADSDNFNSVSSARHSKHQQAENEWNSKYPAKDVHWAIDGERLQKFVSHDSFTKYGYKKFTLLDGIHGNLCLYPRGKPDLATSEDRVVFECAIKKMPFDIDGLTLLITLTCKETLTEYLCVKTFEPVTLAKHNKIAWSEHCLSFKECYRIGHSRHRKQKQLTFVCRMQVCSVHYNGTNVSSHNSLRLRYKNYYKSITMNEHLQFRWNIRGKLLKRFLKASEIATDDGCNNGYGFGTEHECFYSPELNDCWMFVCQPNSLSLWLQLIGLPKMISSIKIRLISMSNYTDTKQASEHNLSFEKPTTNLALHVSTLLAGITACLSSLSETLSFMGIISIVQVKDIKGIVVERDAWHKYNIVCS